MATKMSNVEEDVAGTSILTIAIVSAIFVVLSIFVIWSITSNFYVSVYFTFSDLFDATGFSAVLPTIPAFSTEFYQLFSFLLVGGIVKIVIIGFLIASLIEIMSNANITSKFNIISAKKLKHHVIICGYSTFSERLIKDLVKAKKKFVIIEKDKTTVDTLNDMGYTVIDGDSTRDIYLKDASLKTADAVIIDSQKDFYDVLTLIAIRRMNKDINVIVRVNDESSVDNLKTAGASQCIIPEIFAGMELGDLIIKKFGAA